MTKEVEDALREEMGKRGIEDNDLRAGLAAIVGGESGFNPKFETGYAHTDNARIRRIFSSRIGTMPDDQLTELKASDEEFFNFIYSMRFQNIHHLGNIHEDDGYKYRGGGLIQLTGRANYTVYAGKVGVDLVNHPELINTPRVAAAVAVEYMKDRYHGGDFDAMKRAVGISIGEPDETKNKLFASYTRSGEWNYDAGKIPVTNEPVAVANVRDPVVSNFVNALHALQDFLRTRKLYSGPTDDDPGPGTRAALAAYTAAIKRQTWTST